MSHCIMSSVLKLVYPSQCLVNCRSEYRFPVPLVSKYPVPCSNLRNKPFSSYCLLQDSMLIMKTLTSVTTSSVSGSIVVSIPARQCVVAGRRFNSLPESVMVVLFRNQPVSGIFYSVHNGSHNSVT